jgi:hypothetical protein
LVYPDDSIRELAASLSILGTQPNHTMLDPNGLG